MPWLCTEVKSWSILCWYFHVFSTQFKRCWKGSMNTRMSKAQGMKCPMFMTYHGQTKPTKVSIVPVGFGLGFSYSAILFPKNWDSIVNPRFFLCVLVWVSWFVSHCAEPQGDWMTLHNDTKKKCSPLTRGLSNFPPARLSATVLFPPQIYFVWLCFVSPKIISFEKMV